MRASMLLQRLNWIEESVKDVLKMTDPTFQEYDGYIRSVGEIFESISEMRDELAPHATGVFRIVDYFCPDGLEGFVTNEEGVNLEFETYHEALNYAKANLQEDFYKIVEV